MNRSTRELLMGVYHYESLVFGMKPFTPLEKLPLDKREKFEKRYQENPTRMHAYLVHHGYWMIASQLKIDYQVDRLRPPVVSLTP